MFELILEIAGFLGSTLLIGLFFGYLIWGWGQRERIETARADGAARARTSVDGDPALESKVQILTAERDKLSRTVEALKTELGTLRDDNGDGDVSDADGSEQSEPLSMGAEPAVKSLSAFAASRLLGSSEAGGDGTEDRPPRSVFGDRASDQSKRSKEGAGDGLQGSATPPIDSSTDRTGDASVDKPETASAAGTVLSGPASTTNDADAHAIPAFFGDRPGRRFGGNSGTDPASLIANDAEDGEFMDADVEPVDEERARRSILSGTELANEPEADSANSVKNVLTGDPDSEGADPPLRRSRLFARSQTSDDQDTENPREAQLSTPASDFAGAPSPTSFDTADNLSEISDGASTEVAPTPMPAVFLRVPPEDIDNLKLIRGIGKKMEATLNRNGVYQYRQIAGFSESDIQWLTSAIQSFPGRIRRDDWIGQATTLHREKYGNSD